MPPTPPVSCLGPSSSQVCSFSRHCFTLGEREHPRSGPAPLPRYRVPKSVTTARVYGATWPSLLHFKPLLHIYLPSRPQDGGRQSRLPCAHRHPLDE